MRKALLCAALAGAAAACSEKPVPGPPPPTPGAVDVFVLTPHTTDRAMLVTIAAPIAAFTPADGVQHFQNTSGSTTTLLLVAAADLGVGETRLGSFDVPDISRVPAIASAIREVADGSYDVRSDLSGYSLFLRAR